MKPVVTLLIVLFFSGLNTSAVGQPSRESQIKVAFLFNIAKFVEWPEKAFEGQNAPISYCVIGQDTFGSFLNQALEKKTIRGRGMIVERPTKDRRLQSCHLLFISSSEQIRLAQIFESLETANVLTVGDDIEGFASLGGIINLIKRGNKFRFEINRDVANQAGLKLDYRLLKLAIIVE